MPKFGLSLGGGPGRISSSSSGALFVPIFEPFEKDPSGVLPLRACEEKLKDVWILECIRDLVNSMRKHGSEPYSSVVSVGEDLALVSIISRN